MSRSGQIICDNCGSINNVDDLFCGNCGKALSISGSDKNDPSTLLMIVHPESTTNATTSSSTPPKALSDIQLEENPYEPLNPYEASLQAPPPPRRRVMSGMFIGIISVIVVAIVILSSIIVFALFKQGARQTFVPVTVSTATKASTPSPLPVITSPPQYTYIGDQDINGYCRSLGYPGSSLNGHTAQDWHCITQSGTQVAINLTNECRWQYNRSDTIAVMLDFNNPDNTHCYVPWH